MIFDSHAHYNDDRFSEDRDAVLAGLAEQNVGMVMNACAAMEEIEPILALTDKYPFLYASVGVHPHDAVTMKMQDLDTLRKAAKHQKVKAIGEIGLDYFYDNSPRMLQKEWFSRQLELAEELSLPVIIHDRDAHKDTMDILRAHNIPKIGGVFHCYAGSTEMAKEILDWGMYIAFGGSLTFKNARRTVENAEFVPLDRLLVETDCPYLTPEPYRGKRNDSSYLRCVVKKLSEIKGIPEEEIEKITYENAKKCFHIQEEE